MLVEKHIWDTTNYPEYFSASLHTNFHHHHDDNQHNNKTHNVGRAFIHKYKSPHALEPTTDNNKFSRLQSLTHCQKCLNPFQQPVTLSCGFTLCLNCLPASSQCLSFSCLRTHKQDNYKPTVLLENILSQFNTATDNEENLKMLLDCSICLSTLTQPITTQCGHTFCKECLIRTMTDMNSRSCPYCRTELSRIGKENQVICGWLDYLNNSMYYYQDEDEEHEAAIMSQHQHIPIIQVTSAVAFPTQHYLIHIAQDNRSLLKHMITHPHQKHYAICVFSRPLQNTSSSANEFFEYGLMLQINHVEHIPDIRHSVVQAIGLFRLRINQLTVDMEDCYTGDVTRLDDLVENNDEFIIDCQLLEQTKSKRWTMPTTVITTQSTPSTPTTSTSTNNTLVSATAATRKMTRLRPCSMRLSSSAPNNYQFSASDNYPGKTNRRAWAAHFGKPLSPPPTFITLNNKKLQQQPSNMTKVPTIRSSSTTTSTTTTLETLFDQELHPYLVQYLTSIGDHVWMMQYDWYLQQSDHNSLIWWIANILPLDYHEKIHLLSMVTLLERIMTLIVWTDKWRS